jgi:hypothetical protein
VNPIQSYEISLPKNGSTSNTLHTETSRARKRARLNARDMVAEDTRLSCEARAIYHYLDIKARDTGVTRVLGAVLAGVVGRSVRSVRGSCRDTRKIWT